MKTFKKLFLSATTILMTTGAVDPAQAFVFLNIQNALYNAQQQQSPQQVANLQTITPEITVKSHPIQAYHPVLTALPTTSQQQLLDQFGSPESLDAFSLLIQHLATVFAVQNQGDNNPEETRKFRTQLIKLAQKFKARHYAPQSIAKVDDKPQAVMISSSEDRVILSREEFARLTDQISALTEQVGQLRGNHQDLIGSVSALHASYGKGHRNLSLGFPSSALRTINASTQEETSNSTTSTAPQAVATSTDTSTTEEGETLTNEPSPTSNTDTSTGTEDDTAQTAEKSATSTLLSDTAVLISSSRWPEIAGDSQPALMSDTWKKEEFEQAVLGIRPAALSPMDETEANLWRTFTVLRFAGISAENNKEEVKQWTSWGGAFSTEELEEKFKGHSFMERAFKDIVALHTQKGAPVFFPQITEYFLANAPNLTLDSDKDTDLMKAYYFRGLYRALTGDNWKGRSSGSMATGFTVNPTTGIKGGRFNYGSDTPGMASYESSIYDAEAYFQDTPWHPLFINKVQQVAISSLFTREKEIKEFYFNEMRAFFLQQKSRVPAEGINDQTDLQDDQTEKKAVTSLNYNQFVEKRDRELDTIMFKRMHVQNATSLRDIDEALEIS